MIPFEEMISVRCNVSSCNANYAIESMLHENDEVALKHVVDHAVSEGWRRVGIGVRCPSCVARFGVGRVKR